MKTVAKNKSTTKATANVRPLPVLPNPVAAPDYPQIPLAEIVVSPLNYRKYIDPKGLAQFAANLAIHGIISPVMLRQMPSGSYELVVGERRFKGAAMAGLQSIPAVIRELTDEMVNEIQLAENVQRENPHPFHEAQAVTRMQQTGKSIDEIAARLGKSKTFVYSRIKLSGLIEPWQDIFLADKVTAQEAYQVATLSPQSQYDFYESYGTDWRDDDFQFPGSHAVNKFRYDLTNAPFDIKDKKLVAEKGACTKCPLNSATLQTLFPELAKKAICSGAECYHSKCNAHYERQIIEAASKMSPQALVYNNSSFFDEVAPIIDRHENLKDLPRYATWGLRELKAPTPPEKDHYTQTDEQTEYYDEQGYNLALDDYNTELDEYHAQINDGQTLSGLLITAKGARFMLFIFPQEREPEPQTMQVTAKAVQAAIKDGTITLEMIEAEIDRINTRETRYQEIDRDRIQSEMHLQFFERFGQLENNTQLTTADNVAVRLIVFQSLDYHVQRDVEKTLCLEIDSLQKDQYFETFSALTDAQFAYLLRMAIAGKTYSNKPDNINGWCLEAVGTAAGLNVQAIRDAQQEIAEGRQQRTAERIKELERKKAKLMAAKTLEESKAAA